MIAYITCFLLVLHTVYMMAEKLGQLCTGGWRHQYDLCMALSFVMAFKMPGDAAGYLILRR